MAEVENQRESDDTATETQGTARSSVVWLLFGIPLIVALLSFFAARWFGWPLGWLYVGHFAADHIFGWLCVRIWNPVLISRRSRIGGNTKSWDIAILVGLTAGMGAAVFVATIDPADPDATADRPGPAWLLAAFVFAWGYGLILWCSVVNPFLEKTVRIQTDHQQRVIQTGPYAFVRHPMYVGVTALLLATPAMLDSWRTIIPLSWCVVILIIRTALEDRTLQAELPGYSEYSGRVRYRLIPRLW